MAINGYYTAKQIIKEALFAVGDVDNRQFNKATMYFMRGLRDYNLFRNTAVQQRWCTITEANTVNFPEDMIRLLWVGCSLNGELFSFTKSNRIVSPTTAPLDDYLDTSRGEDEGIQRGVTSGYAANAVNVEYYYTVDMNKNRIVLKRPAAEVVRYSDRSEVLVGYVGTGVTDLDKTFVLSDAANMLISYIEWKLTEDKKGTQLYMIQIKKQNYEEACRMYECLDMPSIDELFDVIYETSSQTVRV